MMDHKLIIIGFCLLGLIGCQQSAVAPGHRLELHLASNTAQPDFHVAALRSTGDTVYMDKNSIVDTGGFDNIWIAQDRRGTPCIMFRVNASSAAKLAQVTQANKGELLVIVIGGNPEIAIPISSEFADSFMITGGFGDLEIEQTFAKITGHPDH